LFGALWLAAASSFFGLSGQPTERDGRYYLNNHGEVNEVSRSEYDKAENSQTRLFAAVPGALLMTAAMLSRYGGPTPDPSGPEGASTDGSG
jgi:hypothetical protein